MAAGYLTQQSLCYRRGHRVLRASSGRVQGADGKGAARTGAERRTRGPVKGAAVTQPRLRCCAGDMGLVLPEPRRFQEARSTLFCFVLFLKVGHTPKIELLVIDSIFETRQGGQINYFSGRPIWLGNGGQRTVFLFVVLNYRVSHVYWDSVVD